MTVEELISQLEVLEPTRTIELAVRGDGVIHTAEAVRVVRLHNSLALITSEAS